MSLVSRVAGVLRQPFKSRSAKDGPVKGVRSATYDDALEHANAHGAENNSFQPKDKGGVAHLPQTEVAAFDPRQLETRKEEEKDFIRKHDTAQAEVWYLVDVQWLQEWKSFVTKGGPPPGPIDNSRLLDQRGQPRRQLRPADDYRGVNAAIWSFWQERYRGGPTVRRRELDLYSPPLEEEADSSHTLRNERRLEGVASAEQDDSPSVDTYYSRGGGTGAASRSSSRRLPEVGSARQHREERQRNDEAAMRTSPQPRGRERSSGSSRGTSAPVTRVGVPPPIEAPKKLCCDKCDGPHETDRCPHFKKQREKHIDAWSSYGKAKGGGGPDSEVVVVRREDARVVPQPGDGSCLFHSLSYGLHDSASSAYALRQEICRYIAQNPDMRIADTALQDWIRYDSGGSVSSYAQKMSSGTWGGGIEMAAFTRMKNVNVHVYERCEEGYRRISAFRNDRARRDVSVLYQGRMHYDALVLAS